MNKVNLYQILGVKPDATDTQINFLRNLVKKYHQRMEETKV